jgi:hypothetical protein
MYKCSLHADDKGSGLDVHAIAKVVLVQRREGEEHDGNLDLVWNWMKMECTFCFACSDKKLDHIRKQEYGSIHFPITLE